jgi:hypothetical protein
MRIRRLVWRGERELRVGESGGVYGADGAVVGFVGMARGREGVCV